MTARVPEALIFPVVERVEIVVVARVDVPVTVKRLVTVDVATVSVLIVALVPVKLVVKKLVEVPEVMTEVEAKMFWTKRLRNLLSEVPSE